MAVLVFKDNQQLKIDPQYLQHHLDMGWSLDKPGEKNIPDQVAERETEQTAEIESDQVTEKKTDQVAEKKPKQSRKNPDKNQVSDE